MRLLAPGSRGEALKVITPTLVYARGVAEELLVEGVKEIGVTAVERCRFKHAERGKQRGASLT
jgi:hypothetical protein